MVLRLTTDVPIAYLMDETPFNLEMPVTLVLGPDESLLEGVSEIGREFGGPFGASAGGEGFGGGGGVFAHPLEIPSVESGTGELIDDAGFPSEIPRAESGDLSTGRGEKNPR